MGKYWQSSRPKGAIGQSHATARHAIVEVYKLNGGVQGLWNWMRKSDENERAFYTILLPKLIPAEIADQHGAGDTRIQVIITPAPTQAIVPTVEPLEGKPLDRKAGGLLPQPGGPDEDS